MMLHPTLHYNLGGSLRLQLPHIYLSITVNGSDLLFNNDIFR